MAETTAESRQAQEQVAAIMMGFAKSMTMKAICLLNIPDILAKAGPKKILSLQEIAKALPSDKVNMNFLARIMNASAVYGIFAAKKDHDSKSIVKILKVGHSRYGLNNLSKCLVKESNPTCMTPQVIMHLHEVVQAGWHHLHEAVLTGQQPFSLAHPGLNMWEFTEDNPEFSMVFNDAMVSYTSSVDYAVISNYKGLEGAKTIVDVGGGTGLLMKTIVSKYPDIHGINYDLPHVIAEAPQTQGLGIPGWKHVGGNMFESVPEGDVILMKFIMHDWNDEKCVAILKNCLNSIPEHGKVLILDLVVPSQDDHPFKVMAITMDLTMLAHQQGGIERTKEQWQALLKSAGFARCEFIELSSASATQEWLIEAYKH